MRFRTCICGPSEWNRISFCGEESIIIFLTDIIPLSVHRIPEPIKFFLSYSLLYDVSVFLYVEFVENEDYPCIVVIEKGRVRCVAESIEKGGKCRKIYKGMGLCVGSDLRNAYNAFLFAARPSAVLMMTGERFDPEIVKTMFIYKNCFPMPVLFVCREGIYYINKKIYSVDNNAITEIERSSHIPICPKGYMKICIID